MNPLSLRSAGRRLLPWLVGAALLVLPAPFAAAQVAATDPALLPPGSLRGEAAISALGDRLADVAAANDTTPEVLADRLRSDDSLWVDASGRLFFVDAPKASRPAHDAPLPEAATIPPEDAFTLHSKPGANRVIYLDFDGHHSFNNSWGHDIEFPAYNTAGTAASFSTSELNEIITWWLYIKEDYAPFDVDVTTEEPPAGGLTKNGIGDQTWGIRCVITQPTDGFGDTFGGIAFLNSFNDSIDNPCFVVNKGNNNGSMSASHEVGHTLGLSHDGLGGQSYHPGSGSGETSWGPIMGAPFGHSLVQWSNGDYANSTNTENDVAVITKTSNGVNTLADDIGDDETDTAAVSDPVACPEPLPGSAEGLIETRNDVDAFSFTTTAGVVTINAVPTSPGGNLDLQIDLRDAAGVPIAIANQEDQADAALAIDLPAGDYVVLVDGVGKAGEYSDYGCLGQYTISVTLPGTAPVTNLGGGVAAGTGITPALQVVGTPCPGNALQVKLFNAPFFANAFLGLGLGALNVPFKGGVLVPNVTPPTGGLVPLNTGFVGAIFLDLTWPLSLPPGTEFYLQYWIQDAGAPFGFAATDGVRLYQP